MNYKPTLTRLKHFPLKFSFLLRLTTVLMAFAMFGIAFSTNLCFFVEEDKSMSFYKSSDLR